MTTPSGKTGKPITKARGAWVQTERKSHLAWANLIRTEPKAAILLHLLVSMMNKQNAVVISQNLMASMMGCSIRTVRRAINALEEGLWVQKVALGKGAAKAYVVNSRVAWSDKRDNLQYSIFNAVVVADGNDQDEQTMVGKDLRELPLIHPNEKQFPDSSQGEPPEQEVLDGMLPDLPSMIRQDD